MAPVRENTVFPGCTHFFFFDLLLDAEPGELFDATLDARDGEAELALLAVADLTLSSALFWIHGLVSAHVMYMARR